MKKLNVSMEEANRLFKKARFKWRLVLFAVLLILLIDVVVAYFIIAGHGLKKSTGLEAAVVKIHNNTGMGTGFFVTGKYVLTAAHVAGDVGAQLSLENAEGTTWNGKVIASGYTEWQKFVIGQGKVKEGADAHDWALVEVDEPSKDLAPLLLGTVGDASQGATVFLAGHPQDQPLTITKGVISRIEVQVISTDGEVDPGFSGGPMILVEDANSSPAEGTVVGIVVSVPEGMTTVKSAVPIDLVVKKCKEAGFDLY